MLGQRSCVRKTHYSLEPLILGSLGPSLPPYKPLGYLQQSWFLRRSKFTSPARANVYVLERMSPYSDLAFPLAWHGAEGVHHGDQGLCSLGRFPTSFVVQIPMVSNSQRAMIIMSFVVDSFFLEHITICLPNSSLLRELHICWWQQRTQPQVGYEIPNLHGSWQW